MKLRTVLLSIAILLLLPQWPGVSASRLPAGTAFAQEAGGVIDASLTDGPRPPDLAVTLTPHNPPVVIPASGGTFQYAVEVENNGTSPATFEVWTTITGPEGLTVNPAAGPFRVHIPHGWSAGRDDLSQEIPAADPPGSYTYTAHAGRYPSRILATDSFTFEKLPGGGWFPQSSGTSDWLFDVHFADANNGWAVGQTNEIVHTSNGGDVWNLQSTPVFSNLWAVFAVDAQNAWAGGSGAVIIHTSDGGANWVQQSTGLPGSYDWQGFHFLDASTGWVVGGKPHDFTAARRVILRTTDGGANWQVQYSVSGETPLNAVHFVDANNGWAVGDGSGILHTSDGGATWVQQTSGTGDFLEDVYFTDASNGWAVGRNGTLIHTTDGGATWVPQNLGTADDLTGVHFADASHGWISGTDGSLSQAVIYHTSDGGTSWNTQDPGPALILYSIVFADASSGWAAGDNGTIIHTDTGGE